VFEQNISVIMAVYNNEDTVQESILSILNQSYENFELLIIDDASTDSSYFKIDKMARQDFRIKVRRNETNIGLTKSLNKLIKLSKGEILARQDGDDISQPKRFESQINFLKDDDFEFCVTRAKSIQTGKNIPNLSFYLPDKLTMNYKNPFIHGTLMIKKETIKRVGMYNEKFYYSQDFKLFKDLLNSKVKYKYLKESYYLLNTENNISKNFQDEQRYFFNCAKNNINP